MTEEITPAKVRLSDQLGRNAKMVRALRLLAGEHDDNRSVLMIEAANILERLHDIVTKGRDAYSVYGLLATPPDHPMYTEAGNTRRGEWLYLTDEFLRGIEV